MAVSYDTIKTATVTKKILIRSRCEKCNGVCLAMASVRAEGKSSGNATRAGMRRWMMAAGLLSW